jgi:hypothetical protein
MPDRVGERVWVWNGQWKRPHGTAAQYIVLPSVQAVRLPDRVDYAAGACPSRRSPGHTKSSSAERQWATSSSTSPERSATAVATQMDPAAAGLPR